MPMTFAAFTTPGGRAIVRTVSTQDVAEVDARALEAVLVKGGRFYGVPSLHIVEPSASYSPESRKVFGNMSGDAPAAVVVSNPATRVMLNFIIKAIALKAAATTGGKMAETVFFKTEAEALAWLDTRP